MNRRKSTIESDEFTNVFYVTEAPRRRDFLKVLLGRWTPEVRRVEQLSIAGFHRELKDVWNSDVLTKQFYTDNAFLDLVESRVVVTEGNGDNLS